MNQFPKFEIGFWHPFGPHADESPDEIIKRKQSEIRNNGWTLWSFQFRNSLSMWFEEIEKTKPNHMLVFCSESRGAADPIGERRFCSKFKLVNDDAIETIPSQIKIPHPLGKKAKASAFIVKQIIDAVDFKRIPIMWFRTNGQWETSPLPTRPEYLIKPGDGGVMRPVRAILVLKYPYLSEVYE